MTILYQDKKGGLQVQNRGNLQWYSIPFNKNSFVSFIKPNEANDLIKTIKQWGIEDKYQLGLDRCMNKVEKIIFGI